MKLCFMKNIFLLLLFSLSLQSLNAQIDEELGFLFVKGKYLMDTERYDDAITEFNKIIKDKPEYDNVLLLRAEAKYALGAYLGVRNDVIQYIEYNGVSAGAARLLGLADFELKNFGASKTSLKVAADSYRNDVNVFIALAEINYQNGNNLSACENWEQAARLGSSRAKRKLKSNCGITVQTEDRSANQYEEPRSKKTRRVNSTPNTNTNREVPSDSTTASTDDIDIIPPKEEDSRPEEKPYENERVYDEDYIDIDAINEIYVDEDLTLLLRDGLGDLKVLEQPNILILSDDSGLVTVDVCVTPGGRVESAKYNKSKSSLSTKSIISLAVRKSKEFWFEKNRSKDPICGMLQFVVSGRE